MRRLHALLSLGFALALVSPAAAQESTSRLRSPRAVPAEADSENPEPAPTQLRTQRRTLPPALKSQIESRIKTHIPAQTGARPARQRQGIAATLAELNLKAPYVLSSSGKYLVATDADSGGLILCDVVNHKRLRTLQSSGHTYAVLQMCGKSRWIAAVRSGDQEHIDLWRADNGDHLAVLEANEDIQRVEFVAGRDELKAHGASGRGLVFSVPDGKLIGGSQTANGGSAVQKPTIAQPPRVRSSPPTFTHAKPPAVPKVEEFAAPPASAPSASAPRQFEFRAEEPHATEAAEPTMSAPPSWSSSGSSAADSALPGLEGSQAPPRIPRVSSAPRMSAPTPVPTMSSAPQPAPHAMMREGDPSGGSAQEVFENVGSALPPSAAASPEESAAPDDSAPSAAAPPPGVPAAPDSSFGEPTGEESSAPAVAAPEASEETAVRGFRFETEAPESDAAMSEAEESASEAEETPSDAAASPAEPTEASPEPAAAAPASDGGATALPAVSPPPAPDPSKVIVHYATNRNRLASKDREWLVYFKGFFSTVPAFVIYALMLFTVLILPWFGKRSWAAYGLATGAVLLCAMGSLEAYVRSSLRDELSGELFGARATDVSYGACEISVPPAQNRNIGEVSRPVSVWVFQAPENPNKHFVLSRVDEHADKDAFLKSLSGRLEKTGTDAALVFIHGYNVSFEDAVFRTAQLAVDLKFPGVPVTFSWPSYADAVKYTFDEQNAEVSIPALRELLTDLATKSGAKRIHVIAHSMGNRVLAGALKGMDDASRAVNKEVIREIVLAAPDIDSRVFKSQVLPHIVANTQHCTLYASSRDRALLISRYFHNFQRLGETEPDLILASGMDTIDASMVDTSLLGHSYIGDVQSIVSDLHALVVFGKRPSQRLGLEALNRAGLTYWSINPMLETASGGSTRR